MTQQAVRRRENFSSEHDHDVADESVKRSRKGGSGNSNLFIGLAIAGLIVLAWIVWQMYSCDDEHKSHHNHHSKPRYVNATKGNENPYYQGDKPCTDCARPITLWPLGKDVEQTPSHQHHSRQQKADNFDDGSHSTKPHQHKTHSSHRNTSLVSTVDHTINKDKSPDAQTSSRLPAVEVDRQYFEPSFLNPLENIDEDDTSHAHLSDDGSYSDGGSLSSHSSSDDDE